MLYNCNRDKLKDFRKTMQQTALKNISSLPFCGRSKKKSKKNPFKCLKIDLHNIIVISKSSKNGGKEEIFCKAVC